MFIFLQQLGEYNFVLVFVGTAGLLCLLSLLCLVCLIGLVDFPWAVVFVRSVDFCCLLSLLGLLGLLKCWVFRCLLAVGFVHVGSVWVCFAC